MTSKDVKEYIKNNELHKLLKKFQPKFDLVDQWEDKLTGENLLNEYDLGYCQQVMSGCISAFSPVAGALESNLETTLATIESQEYDKIGDVKSQHTSVAKAKARSSVGELRDIASDFRNYFISADKIVVMCQSRMKRLSVEKSSKHADYTGEVPQTKEEKKSGW